MQGHGLITNLDRKGRNVGMKTIIWGTGSLVKSFIKYEYLNLSEVIGFVDSNKNKAMFMERPVYQPQELLDLVYDRILICVLKHNQEIQQKCIELGLDQQKIFFLHNAPCYEGITDDSISNNLEIVKKEYPMMYNYISERVQQYAYINEDVRISNRLEDFSLIRHVDSKFLVAWIPIELIFSERREDNINVDNVTEEWEKQNVIYQDIPLISFIPYRNLYQFFSSGKELPLKYCEWFQNLFISRGMKSGYTNESLIEKRYREYKRMSTELQNNGLQFFIDYPAVGKWNDKGYFNLIDGHHRISFLYERGFRIVPVQVTEIDYRKWANKDMANRVRDIILNENRTEFYQPILNPYFMSLHPHREDVNKSRLQMLLEYFGIKRFNGAKVIDIGANLGFFGAAFSRMGADVTLIEPDSYHYKLTSSVTELMYIDANVVTSTFEDFETNEQYDIAIMLTVFYHQMSKPEIRDRFISKLNAMISSMIIWESGDKIEEEKSFILNNTKFKKYTHIGYTFATDKFRELGIFSV